MFSPSHLPREKASPSVWAIIEAEAVKRIAQGGKVVKLHIGDTYLPFPQTLLEPVPGEDKLFPLLNRYGDTFGEIPLREMILAKVISRNHLPAEGLDCIQVTAGATGALQAAFQRLLSPGAEVLTLAPYWSILRNVAAAAGVKLVETPFYDLLPAVNHISESKSNSISPDPYKLMERHITPKTGAIYLNTPSNPTGITLNRPILERLAGLAQNYDLWVFADEAYEDFVWEGEAPVSIGSLPGMWERTVSVYTFSKCFGVSGVRVGYAAAPNYIISQLNRTVVGACYHAPRMGQLCAWRGMQRFNEICAYFRENYAPTWRFVKENLRLKSLPSAATFYFFVYLGDSWKGMPSLQKVQRMVQAGVSLAPGEYFGDDYQGWARMCWTVAPPEEVREAVDRLNRMD